MTEIRPEWAMVGWQGPDKYGRNWYWLLASRELTSAQLDWVAKTYEYTSWEDFLARGIRPEPWVDIDIRPADSPPAMVAIALRFPIVDATPPPGTATLLDTSLEDEFWTCAVCAHCGEPIKHLKEGGSFWLHKKTSVRRCSDATPDVHAQPGAETEARG